MPCAHGSTAAAHRAAAQTVTVEGHGRDALTSDTDFAGTIGWFTSEFPVRVPTDALLTADDLADALSGGAAAGHLLRAVKEAKRAVPGGGVGYGVLRHLDPDTAPDLSACATPELLLNYLGRFPSLPGTGWRLPEQDPFAVIEPATKVMSEVLALNAFVREDDSTTLAVEWTAAGSVLDGATIVELQEHWERALAALTAHAALFEGGLTPSDCSATIFGQGAVSIRQGSTNSKPSTDRLPTSFRSRRYKKVSCSMRSVTEPQTSTRSLHASTSPGHWTRRSWPTRSRP